MRRASGEIGWARLGCIYRVLPRLTPLGFASPRAFGLLPRWASLGFAALRAFTPVSTSLGYASLRAFGLRCARFAGIRERCRVDEVRARAYCTGRVSPSDALLLAGAGLVAGVVNTLAGGGSLLTVPLLVMLGLPGPVANGTNRVGVLLQSAVATWRFAAHGIPGLREAAPLLAPTALGALLGAYGVVQLPADLFNRAFGLLMLVLLVPTLRGVRGETQPRRPLPPLLRWLVFFAIGIYGGAFQAGVGILLISALSLAGHDLVRSNHIKTALNTCFTLLALPIFLLAGQVAWSEALVLGAGFAAGGAAGAKLAVLGGARLIRPVFAVAVIALAGRMLGLY